MLKMKNDKLLLAIIKQKDVSKDGVIYTESQRHRSFKGEVIATSDDCGYEVGDIVVFSEFAGEEVSVDGKKCLIIDSENVWAVEVEDEI